MSKISSKSLGNYTEDDTPIYIKNNNEIDVFDELEHSYQKTVFTKRHNNTPTSQYTTITTTTTVTTNDYDGKLYCIPSTKSKDARNIWIQAHIPNFVSYNEIETSLAEWAYNHAEIIQNGLITSIKWKSSSGIYYNSDWKTFIKWILCASES